MDLNSLYSQHQIALIRAATSPGCDDRRRFHAFADGIALRIRALQDTLGAKATALIPAAAL